mmetsp:Transcript_63356/g.138798  ORF Transcript_63356/g.138798 Transcript_63356/m.138798 type:complete len:369 (-) Transcript_63356:171-1277(-)
MACYGPSAVRAVHLVVKRIPVVVGKVRAVDVVDDAVAIVIDSIVRDFVWIGPHPLFEILMRVVNACVDHCHHHVVAGRCGEKSPRFNRVDVSTTEVVHAPEFFKRFIVWDHRVPAVHRGDVELLPVVDLLAVRRGHAPFRVLRGQVLVRGLATKRHAAILVVDEFELLKVIRHTMSSMPARDASTGRGHQVGSVLILQGHVAINVGHYKETCVLMLHAGVKAYGPPAHGRKISTVPAEERNGAEAVSFFVDGRWSVITTLHPQTVSGWTTGILKPPGLAAWVGVTHLRALWCRAARRLGQVIQLNPGIRYRRFHALLRLKRLQDIIFILWRLTDHYGHIKTGQSFCPADARKGFESLYTRVKRLLSSL